MFQTRIHGRGGQGVVTAAELLADAAFREGHHAQAIPSFGSERTGAPVVAYCRISSNPIRTREPIGRPDALIIQDPTLVNQVDVLAGLVPHGYVLLNSTRTSSELGLNGAAEHSQPERLLTVPATEMAVRNIGKPVPNSVLLGAFAALTEHIGLDSVAAALLARFPGGMGRSNVAAATEAFTYVVETRQDLQRTP